MNDKWQNFLADHGPDGTDKIANGNADWLAELGNLGVIEVAGTDAATFLQAHFTNDVMALGQNNVQLSGYCSPKGRLLAVFYLLQKGDSYFLVTSADVVASTLQRLGMFAQMARPTGKQTIGKVMRTAVELNDVSDHYVLTGIAGQNATNALVTSFGAADKSTIDAKHTSRVLHKHGLSAFRVPSADAADTPRWIAFGDPEEVIALWNTVAAVAVPVKRERWSLEDIRAGVPSVVLDTQDKIVPQMANMHVLDGISFTKGCYPGQEIVARMQYLGTLKRHAVRFRFSGKPVAPGTEIMAGEHAGAGIVMASAAVDDARSEALAVVKISVENEPLVLAGSGTALTRDELPYAEKLVH